jgi:hypothetical protein
LVTADTPVNNDSIEGRARNRRVSIQIDSALPEKPTELPVEISPAPVARSPEPACLLERLRRK